MSFFTNGRFGVRRTPGLVFSDKSIGCALVAGASLSLATAAGAQESVIAPTPAPITTIAVPSKVLADSSAAAVAASARALEVALPQERRLNTLPAEALQVKPAVFAPEAQPSIMPGGAPQPSKNTPPARPPVLPKATTGGIEPDNYGLNNLNTIYHYTDNLVDPIILQNSPHRQTGWFVFVTSTGGISRCSASLISKSILVTAGHCVHSGGTKATGFIRGGTFYAAYENGLHLGVASANAVYTTNGWYNVGQLDKGYDVGIVVLNKRSDTPVWFPPQELGTAVGWYAFCYSGCLQKYWHLSQLGYPANYYSGYYQTQGEHLEASDTRDYLHGSGMQGGSSGGPHISNLGDLSDGTANKGQSPIRNVVFGVTSWGYTNDAIKIQGSSTLSGPNNANNFKGLWNSACTRARALHGSATCALIP